ncbi:hypothetical protein VTL71DRAFT_6291 [Oculimacula yallundae]|uniref:Heterokaryon incompatibility domain-containing protein n=1 Tax=Oculimacula yallundae TaxID=86028 RepID=A0ABR4BWJ4_9HELO
MRLMNVNSMRLEEFFGDQIPRYAILSHCWGKDEITFQDINNATQVQSGEPFWMGKEGARKIRFTVEQAKTEDLEYVWIDTCCIDKTSSAELSEAINSMFSWYENAQVCYAYLEDVFLRGIPETHQDAEWRITRSRWFSRGWTLQELIAPKTVKFFDKDWLSIGLKSDLVDVLSRVTRIPTDVLMDPLSRNALSAARKMSWAAKRNTTRIEDLAYCLLGIFGVNMPLLYGEGKKAFQRLQEEILKDTDDHSLLAWGLENSRYFDDNGDPLFDFIGVLADSADAFVSNTHIGSFLSRHNHAQPCLMTAKGLRIDVELRQYPDPIFQYSRTCALLDCYPENNLSFVLSLELVKVGSNAYVRANDRPAIREYRPVNPNVTEPVRKETIYILNNEPTTFSGDQYQIVTLSAEKLGFRFVEILPKPFSWNPTTCVLQLPYEPPWTVDGGFPWGWTTFAFEHKDNGQKFIITHYRKDFNNDDDGNYWHDHALRVCAKQSATELEEWLESHQVETSLRRTGKSVTLELPDIQEGKPPAVFVIDVEVTETTENNWKVIVEINRRQEDNAQLPTRFARVRSRRAIE